MKSVVRLQNNITSAQGVTSITAPLPQSVVVGNRLVVVVSDNYGALNQVSSMTDNLGNTFSRVTSGTDGSFVDGEIWSAPVTVAGACTVTVHFSHSVDCAVLACEYAGLGIPDQSAAANSTGTSHSSGNTASTSQAYSFVIGAAAANDTLGVFSSGTGYGNLIQKTNGTTGIMISLQHKLASSAGVQSSVINTLFNDHTVSMVVAFKTLSSPPITGVSVFKNGGEITSDINWENFNINLAATREVGSAAFVIKQYTGKDTADVGDQIDIYEDQGANLGMHIFGGTVTEAKTRVIGGILLGLEVTCTDWSYRINSKLVAKNYTGQDPQQIVQDIVSSFASGFTSENVQAAGFNVSISFNYEQVTSALEKLAKMIGWEWYIDPNKDVHFFPAGAANPAPFTVDDTSGKIWWQTIEVDKNLQNLKNSVFVIGGSYTKSYDATTTPDKYTTDGTRITFPLAYPYESSTITVTLDGVTKTVGDIATADPGTVDVLYSKSGKFIQFTSTPATGKTVKIYGNAVIPIIAQAIDQSSIASYGEYQDIIIDKNIKSMEEAQERANAEIARYSTPVYSVNFTTIETGLKPGQEISVSSAKFNLTTSLIVKRVVADGRTPSQLVYKAECVSTDSVNFLTIMKSLLQQQLAANPADPSSIIQKIISFIEEATVSDSLSITTSSPPYKWNSAKWNFSTWAA